MNICPCGSNQLIDNCCRTYHTSYNAPSAEALMRSRYTAFVLGDMTYIKKTMRDAAAQGFNPETTLKWATGVTWLHLEIIDTKTDETQADHAFVEFIATYLDKNHLRYLHELSEFRQVDGKWFYVDGTQPDNEYSKRDIVVPRNAPCPCGSLSKFKNCHGK